MTQALVKIQISPESVPSTPSWFAEAAIVAQVLAQTGLLKTLEQRVRFARARFGTYEVIDFVAMLIGYALSGEATLLDFCDRLAPFAEAFMALFGRKSLPHRSPLSRFLAAVPPCAVETLREIFEEDVLARGKHACPGGLWDRGGKPWLIVDVDGTKAAARQRALPHGPTLPQPRRRLEQVTAKGYLGRKRGEVVRTRTTILQAHTHQWLGTFSGPGNGDYRQELKRAADVVTSYAAAILFPTERMIVRLDGLYGNAAPLLDLLDWKLGWITRGKDYHLLDLPQVLLAADDELRPRARTDHAAGEQLRPGDRAGVRRVLHHAALRQAVAPVEAEGESAEQDHHGQADDDEGLRMIVASHPATSTPAPVGTTRDEVVYELFFTTLPPSAFTCGDVLSLYLHRGSFETVLADEDQEQDPDRWVSHTPCGQEFWQVISQWMWNLRLELGQHLSPTEMRLSEFAPALDAPSAPAVEPAPTQTPPAAVKYGPPQWARTSFTGGFPGAAFPLQSDGSLLCPANHPLYPQERRAERNGSYRLLYAARIGDCRTCSLRAQCQESPSTTKPRRVSAVFWPISSNQMVPSAPLFEPKDALPKLPGLLPRSPVLWGDWPRCHIRRNWLKVVRTETVELAMAAMPTGEQTAVSRQHVISRAQRAHWRLSWDERLARNARKAPAWPLTVTLHGLPATFANTYGFALLARA